MTAHASLLRRVPTGLKNRVKSAWNSKAMGYVRPFIEPFIPELNFITIHYAYFIFSNLLGGIILWVSTEPFRSLSFTDALFLSVSAMTEAGLNTVNLSQLNTFQQVVLFILILIGSAIPVSAVVVWFRLSAFEREFKKEVERRRRERRVRKGRVDVEQGSIDRFRARALTAISRKSTNEAKCKESADKSNDNTTPELKKVPSETTKAVNDESTDPSNSSREGSDETEKTELKDDRNESSPVASRNLTKTVSFPRVEGDKLAPPGPLRLQTTALPPVHERQNVGYGDTQDSPGNDIFSPSDDPWPRRSSKKPKRSNTVRGAFVAFAGVGAVAAPHAGLRHDVALRRTKTDAWFPSSKGFILRNSQFHGLSLEEREELGGLEYNAILFLAIAVPMYFIIWQLLGAVALGAYVKNNRPDVTEQNGLDPFWVGAFNAVSAFNNNGMSLLDANMTAFSNSIYMLISMGLFILAGNTAFPVFLRWFVWACWKLLPNTEYWKSERDALRFLLDHPRRCYTNMFPSRESWYLLGTIVVLNGIDWAMYPLLNIGNSKITSASSSSIEVLDGLFQALAVRSGGFYVVPLSNIRPALQVLYVIMMYIGVYPVTITMRNSNVYEERSLGIDVIEHPDEDEEQLQPYPTKAERESQSSPGGMLRLHRRMTNMVAAKARKRSKKSVYVRQQIRAQLSHDIWVVVLGVFLIMIVEASQFEATPIWFSIFSVIFEVVSGYACVGMSLGVPYNAFSFSGSWHALSKLILCVVMLRGRHRGLPVAIDQAVQLPGKSKQPDEDGMTMLERRSTQVSKRSETGASTGRDGGLLRPERSLHQD